MNMAEYGKISATAYSVRINKVAVSRNQSTTVRPVRGKPIGQLPPNKQQLQPSFRKEPDRKIYMETYLKNFRIVGCLDSDSDITILHMSLFLKIFAYKNQLQTSDIPFITTFSSNSVSVQGKLITPLKLSRHHAGIAIPIYVINDIPHVPSFLLGNDLLSTGMGSISYTGPIGDPKPEVIFNHPVKHYCTAYYESPSKLFMCQAQCTLGPYEIAEVEFSLPPAAPIIRTDHILISNQEWDTVSIFPTRSDVEFSTGKGCYTAVGCVANLSNKSRQYTIYGKYELVNEYNVVNLVEHNKGSIIEALRSYPLGREVLMAKSAAHIQVPLHSSPHFSYRHQRFKSI
jgi:hypothetical protein